MNSKGLTQAIAIFVVLLIVGLLMILLPYQVDLDQAEVETALRDSLTLVGTALVSAGVVFFLLEMTRLERDTPKN
jgi:uncharacterized protein YjeT (DUF2065 family)